MIPFFALFDPQTDKSLETFGVTVGGVAAAAYYIRELFKRKYPKPPNEQLGEAHQAMSKRIDNLETSVSQLWTTMRDEDTSIRESLSKAVADFEGAIGKLDGTLTQVNQTNQMILDKLLS